MKNHLAELRARYAAGERPKFLFFWGHTGTGPGPWALSQWYEAPFIVDGVRYPTAEHWMMAQKAKLFGDDEMLAQILVAPSPGAAKALGREVRRFDADEWEAHRFAAVRTGNVEKFRQNPELGAWLLETGDRILVEASPRDTIWGIGLSAKNERAEDPARWRGRNLLGFALVEARERLRRVPVPRLPEGAVEPPWIAFPGIPPYDVFWRMGAGEGHLMRFHAWWNGLDEQTRFHVEGTWPAQGAWSAWYDPDDGDATPADGDEPPG